MRRLLLAILLASAAVLSSDSKLTTRDKAFYKDATIINFVRPGLVTTIQSAQISADGTVSVRFTVADPRGLPLDRLGVYTPGPVSTSFLIATIPEGQTQYVSYITRLQAGATQATADSGGTYTQNADGDYTYTFRTKAPAAIDRNATHTIGVYSSRNLSEFELGTNFDDDTFDFIPNGGEVAKIRDVTPTAACNGCHNPLSAHGGARRSVELCVMCHTPQTIDGDTGNTMDFPVLVHKIHQGADLPSVQAGTPYQVIGFGNSVHDYSEVIFPQDIRGCTTCHAQPAKQAENYFHATRASCGSCHDNVNFATGEGHIDLPQVSDARCTQCHIPQGDLEFDASILGAHTIPTQSNEMKGVVLDLLSATGGPGERPTVQFKITDKSGNALRAADLNRLAFALAGPTGDYANIPAAANALTAATGSGDGVHSFTFPASAALPADAKGSYSIGVEGYRNVTLLAGTNRQQTARDRALNKVLHFSVDGTEVDPRRQIVDTAKCNSCHGFLSLHGDNRNQVEACVLCHNPNATDVARRPADQGPPQSINFALMIHKIHRGTGLENDYTVFGFGNTPHNFNHVVFPGDLTDCASCHVNGSEQLPIQAKLDVRDPRGPLDPVGPITSACTGCHDSLHTASHALTNTSRLGEACTACHGPDRDYSVSRVHAR